MNLELVRVAYLPDVTLGRLVAGVLELYTLEEPWRRNPAGPGGMRRNAATGAGESCVPDGDYKLTPHNGTHFQNVWRLSNHELGVFDFEEQNPARATWGRATVLIHNGNTVRDIKGCILVGAAFGTLYGLPAVLDSLVSLNKLRELLGSRGSHSLSIRPIAGTS